MRHKELPVAPPSILLGEPAQGALYDLTEQGSDLADMKSPSRHSALPHQKKEGDNIVLDTVQETLSYRQIEILKDAP